MAATGQLPSRYTVIPVGWSNLASSGLVRVHSNLPSSAKVGVTFWLLAHYTVIPVGLSEMPSSGSIRQWSQLLSTGRMPTRSVFTGRYRVLERPLVTTALSPIRDGFVWDKEPLLNYGDVQDIAVGRSGGYLARGLLQFNVATLRTDLIILSAVLRLRCRFAGSGEIGIYPLLGDWDELGVTWANQPPALPMAVATAAAPAQVGTTVDLDITNLFLGWYQRTQTNYGVEIRVTDETTMAATLFGAREAGANWQAQLLVTYYEPDALADHSNLPTSGRARQVDTDQVLSTGTAATPIRVDSCTQEQVAWSGWCFQPIPDGLIWDRKERVRLLYSQGWVRWPGECADVPACCECVVHRVDMDTNKAYRSVYCDYIILYRRTPGPCELPSSGSVSKPGLLSLGLAFQVSSLPSGGQIQSPEFHDSLSGGSISRKEAHSAGVARQSGLADIPSTGTPRVSGFFSLASLGQAQLGPNSLPTLGFVSERSEIPSLGATGQTPDQLPTAGMVPEYSDLPCSGRTGVTRDQLVSTGRPRVHRWQDLPSVGHASGPWMASMGVVHQHSNLYSVGNVRAHVSLPSSGLVYYRGLSELPSGGWPRIRDTSDLLSTAMAKAAHSDISSRGIVTAIVLEIDIDLSAWPPEGRSLFPTG